MNSMENKIIFTMEPVQWITMTQNLKSRHFVPITSMKYPDKISYLVTQSHYFYGKSWVIQESFTVVILFDVSELCYKLNTTNGMYEPFLFDLIPIYNVLAFFYFFTER